MKILPALVVLLLVCASSTRAEPEPRCFGVWAASCAHVPADIRHGRESLARVIRQSEGNEPGAPAFDWDIMIDAGDLCAHQKPPGDADGMELLRQYRALTEHRREQVYNVPGNHDAPYYDHGPGSWFRKWGDPLGEHTKYSGVNPQRRPFPVEGTWERYRFRAGNILFLMLADRNDAPRPVGRGSSSEGRSGGYPPGAVTRETFEWWKRQVLENQDLLIVTMHHHMLRDTTTASGRGEGTPRYHGSTGGAEGSSYLYYLIENDDPEDFRYIADAHVFEDFLADFHEEHGHGAIDFWIGGHTHVKGPDDDFGGKTISERIWGVGFLQVAALTKHHAGNQPLSRLLTFTDGRDEVRARVYLHEEGYRDEPVGFYAPAERTFPLRHPFEAPEPIEVMSPFPEEARVFDRPYRREKRGGRRDFHEAGPSPDLTGGWDPETGGRLRLEERIAKDEEDAIDCKPTLVDDGPDGEGRAMEFDGTERVRVGPLDVDDWSALSVSAWVKPASNASGMRVVSKDRVGAPGCFVLLHASPGLWAMRAWDERAGKWRRARWRSNALDDGRWHRITGVVDAEAGRVSLHVDGEFEAEAPWTAETLDDSDGADLAVGASSGEDRFSRTFEGRIHDVRIRPEAVAPGGEWRIRD